MNTFGSVVKNEIHLLWRRRAFWIVQAVLLLPIILMSFGSLFSRFMLEFPSPVTGFDMPGQFILYLVVLLMPVMVGLAVVRDFGNIGEILWSNPLDPLVHVGGVFIGLWIGLLPGAIMQLAGWWLFGLITPGYLSETALLYSLLLYLVTITASLGMTMFLGAILRRILPLLIIWAALWVGLYILVTGIEVFNPLHSKSLANIFFQNLKLSPSLGLGLEQATVASMVIWFVGIGLAAAYLAWFVSLVVDSRRSLRNSIWILVSCGGVASLLTIGFLLNTRAVSVNALHPSPFDPQVEVWRVNSQQTVVSLDAATGQISGSSTLTLEPQQPLEQSRGVLQLNPGMQLTWISLSDGSILNHERLGDSLVISLAEIPQEPFSLELKWEGKRHVSYTNFEQRWSYHDSPFLYKYFAPQQAGAIFIDRIGYLLRDGDWQPWPWTSAPHQADQNQLTLEVHGAFALTSAPLEDGSATWIGEALPPALLVLPPEHSLPGDPTIYYGDLASELFVQQLQVFAAASSRLYPLLGESPPAHIVPLPYLSQVIRSGALLLVPEGSGWFLSKSLAWLYIHDLTGFNGLLNKRAVLAALTRDWLFSYLPPETLAYKPVTERSESFFFKGLSEPSDEVYWFENVGRWVQPPENIDIAVLWDPRRNVSLKPHGKTATLGFWLAMELADSEVRQADLELIEYFRGEGRDLKSGGDRFRLMYELLWPNLFDAQEAFDLVWYLHQWAELIGTEKAIHLVVEIVREENIQDIDGLLVELENRSGTLIGE